MYEKPSEYTFPLKENSGNLWYLKKIWVVLWIGCNLVAFAVLFWFYLAICKSTNFNRQISMKGFPQCFISPRIQLEITHL